MYLLIKKIFFAASINIFFLLVIFIVIQNSASKSKVNFIIGETIELPTSFIFGSSLISGSFLGTFLPFFFKRY
ncbi:conserved hypothetical protein [Prochlorococcus marinus str. MIT 9301]|uniref:DUF1049 domain-containing protein n=1 Tax=Prochlorococcus marinus (strain MIT 9301) TaxID=167546 RepID=A3PE43_PROM0|nr:conserved hypothetical protein [Prochlorococcus marinus str. MIT 9301]